MPINIFISYSHKDREYVEKLETALFMLIKYKKIILWYDKEIQAGTNISENIEINLKKSDILLAIMSPDSIKSEWCTKERNMFLEDMKKFPYKRIIPIIVRDCSWKDTNISSYNALPYEGNPISSENNQDSAYQQIYDAINNVISSIQPTIKTEYKDFINVTSFNISEYNIKLSEIYQEPKINKIDNNSTMKSLKINDDFFDERNKCVFFVGSVLSGKTSLLYNFINNSEFYNILPIYINSKKYYKTVQHEYEISNLFNEQYIGSFEFYKSKHNKVALIDNYDEVTNRNFIEWINSFFDYVIIAIDYEKYTSYCQNDDLFKNYITYFIEPFNRAKTFSLIEQWATIKYNNDMNKIQQYSDILENKINDIILSRHVFPMYPFYILSVMQALETNSNLEFTSYGDCYQALLLYNLYQKEISKEDISDSAMNFLTYIAYNMYKSTHKTLDNSIPLITYEEIKSNYINEFNIKDSIINRIENEHYKILNFDNNMVRFQFEYIYFFLSSKGIAQNYNINELKLLLNSLPNSNSAYILTFLTHHIKDYEIIKEVLSNLKELYKDENAFLLNTDETQFLRSILSLIPTKIKNNSNIKENRIKKREQADKNELEEDINSKLDNDVEAFEQQKITEKSLQLIKITGQILKNWGGSYKKDVVRELLQEIELLSFRVLSFLIKMLNSEETINMFLSIKNNDNENNSKIEKLIHIMCLDLILRMLSYTFYSISTEKIIQSQKDISQNINAPAFDFLLLLTRLTYENIDIEHIKNLKKKYHNTHNLFAQKTLFLIVQSYLDTHEVNFNQRQALTDMFNMEKKEYVLKNNQQHFKLT